MLSVIKVIIESIKNNENLKKLYIKKRGLN